MASARKTEKKNIAFMDLYKTVDGSIKDRLGSSEGVSEYIRRMDAAGDCSSKVDVWKQDYRMLKHLRWARNKLAHEVDYSTEILDAGDYEWLEAFQKRLRASGDALSVSSRKASGKGKKKKKKSLADRLRKFFFG